MIQSICFRLPRLKPVSYSPPSPSLFLSLSHPQNTPYHAHPLSSCDSPPLPLTLCEEKPHIHTLCACWTITSSSTCTLHSLSLSLSLSLLVWQCVYETFRYRRVHTGRLPCITFSCVGSLHSKVDLLNRPLNFFCSNSFPRIWLPKCIKN